MATPGVSAPSGLPTRAEVPWGAHLCQFYRTGAELAETLVSFFRAGLANGERCVWVTCEPLTATAARAALYDAFPEARQLEHEGRITILDYSDWYLKPGGFTPEAAVAACLALEEEALRDGFTGLRISGNLRWLEEKDWEAFRQYEAHVHEAFHGRRIIALCSYSLDHCGPEDVLDVLRNHGSALLRRDGRWEVTDAATRVMSMVDDPAVGSRHAVQLLDPAAFPAAKIARFLARGLQHGEAAVAIARAEHLTGLVRAWERARVDVGAAMNAERLFLIDADGALAGFMRGGTPDPSLFAAIVGSVLTRLGAGGRRIRAYGEMVDILTLRGETDAALQLEDLWNTVIGRLPLRLLCGYSVHGFEGEDGLARFHAVCDRHQQVLSPRLTGEWPEPAKRRRMVEDSDAQTFQRLRDANEQLLQLQTLTAALSQAATAEDIGHVVVSEIARCVGADGASIAVPDPAGGLRMLASSAVADAGGLVDAGSALVEAWRSGAPVWEAEPGVAVCLPLHFGGRSVGAMRFSFVRERAFAPMDRALFYDLSRQVGGALERARLYDAAAAGEARLQQAQRHKDQFLALLAHELRNPLASMTMALQLMKAQPDAELEREQAVLSRQVALLSRLVEDVVDLSRISQGKFELQRDVISINDVVVQAVELARPFIDRREHQLALDVSDDGLRVDADGVRLAQAIGNLLANAAKYTDAHGQILLSVRRDDGDVVISVRDTGVGIAAAVLPRIFDAFVQGDADQHRSQGGLGLGLAVVKTIVDLHGGHVTAASGGPGLGSEFQIRLAEAGSAGRSKGMSSPRPPVGEPPSPRRVLIVDDHSDGADALAEMLRLFGHVPQAVYDTATALERAAGNAFDVVIVDINLPVMSGYDLARQLREVSGTSRAEFVALTGLDSARDHQRSREEGFIAHLVKPVDGSVLKDLLERNGGASL